MMLAIQSTNPESFSGNNINNLKSGTVLRIPADNLSNYTAKEALAEVQRQMQAWKQGTNPHFPALRSGHRLFQRSSRQKQIPSNLAIKSKFLAIGHHAKSKFLAMIAKMCKKSNKAMMLRGHQIGPIEDGEDAARLNEIIEAASFVGVRDRDVSARECERITGHRPVEATDDAFFASIPVGPAIAVAGKVYSPRI